MCLLFICPCLYFSHYLKNFSKDSLCSLGLKTVYMLRICNVKSSGHNFLQNLRRLHPHSYQAYLLKSYSIDILRITIILYTHMWAQLCKHIQTWVFSLIASDTIGVLSFSSQTSKILPWFLSTDYITANLDFSASKMFNQPDHSSPFLVESVLFEPPQLCSLTFSSLDFLFLLLFSSNPFPTASRKSRQCKT